jgi:hypothetical protein
MSTKVFISWSGPLSQKLGEALPKWLPATLQFVKPYFSPEDIYKGTKWNSEISVELDNSNIGIICLTRDNIEKPWILFEAGALSKSLEKKGLVCTLLFDLEPSDFKGPLTSFQHTLFNREDFKRLVTTINSAEGDSSLEQTVLDKVFDRRWPELEAEITKILQSSDQAAKKELRSNREILDEVLELARSSSGLVEDMAIVKRKMDFLFAPPSTATAGISTVGSSTLMSSATPEEVVAEARSRRKAVL